MTMKVTIYSVLILMVVSSCENTLTPNLSDYEWEVISINEIALNGALPTISFNLEEGKVNGSASCNNFFGSFEIIDDKITFGPLGATRMMCENMTNEDLLFQNIEKVKMFDFDSDILILKSDTDNTVIKCKIKS